MVPSDVVPWALLLLADPSRERVLTYIQKAEIFIGEEAGLVVAVAVLEKTRCEFELKNIAVAETVQRRGLGRQMLEHVLVYAEEAGAKRVTVGTGNSSMRPLAFYQRNGFRITGVMRGFFDAYHPAIIEDGIPCRDLIKLTYEIGSGIDSH